MSFPYSAEPVADCSGQSYSDGDMSATLNGMTTASASLPSESGTDTLTKPQSSVISEHSSVKGTPTHILDWLTALLADFPVKTSVPQELAKGYQASEADCGKQCWTAFASFDRDSQFWKIAQRSLFEDSEQSLGTWPRWGWMRNGVCWERDTPEEIAQETESGLWPAPRATDPLAAKFRRESIVKVISRDRSLDLRLPYFLSLAGVPLSQYPSAFEWTMGWPQGWTDLEPLATDKFQQWLHSHGGCSHED
jgi:hypothetical protein